MSDERDEVYIVRGPATEDLQVFGHAEDADAYGLAVGRNVRVRKVLDHAEARRLIEQEG